MELQNNNISISLQISKQRYGVGKGIDEGWLSAPKPSQIIEIYIQVLSFSRIESKASVSLRPCILFSLSRLIVSYDRLVRTILPRALEVF